MGPTATKLGSWVYLFSKFTPEALLFEAFAILGLFAAYLAFWVLRKRRMGSIENAVPAGLVKVYLNQLIGEAEQLRAQLFGLLTGASPAAGQEAALRGMTPDLLASISAQLPAAGGVAGGDNKHLQALESKMNEQAKAMEAVLVEKRRIEKELADARAAGSKSGGAVDDGMIAKLQEKIRILEGKLAEYSVIEDDLANLKRLQQENAQLKAALNKSGGTVAEAPAAQAAAPAPAAQAAAPAPTATAAAPANQTEPEPAPEPAAEPEAVATPAAEPVAAAAAAAAAPAAPAAAGDPAFESLVDDVEKSLAEAPAPAAAEPAAAAATTTAPTPSLESILTSAAAPAGAASQEKTDADLVAEFEKMLKG